jgi:exodeoxyribonuclease VII large subunit
MRGRRADDLSHQLLRAVRGQLGRRERLYQMLRLALERFDVRRRFGVVRTQLVGVDGRLRSSVDRQVHVADARLRGAAARLESLSPLAVLARGYAVCWNEGRTAIIRDAAAVARGDRVHVKLERGELDCAVTGHGTTEPDS